MRHLATEGSKCLRVCPGECRSKAGVFIARLAHSDAALSKREVGRARPYGLIVCYSAGSQLGPKVVAHPLAKRSNLDRMPSEKRFAAPSSMTSMQCCRTLYARSRLICEPSRFVTQGTPSRLLR